MNKYNNSNSNGEFLKNILHDFLGKKKIICCPLELPWMGDLDLNTLK